MNEKEQAAIPARLRPRLDVKLVELEMLDAENANWSAGQT